MTGTKLTVGKLVVDASSAFGIREKEFLRELALFVTPDAGGDSDPNKATILGYAEAANTRCNYRFAAMVLDFLYSTKARAKTKEQYERLVASRDECRALLAAHEEARYESPPRTNPVSMGRISQIGGTYVLIRRATSDGSLRQELLILAHSGKGESKTYATYVNPELVCRGTWSIIQQTAHCAMHGFRGNYRRRDILNLHLLYEEPDDELRPVLMSGFASGVTSRGIRPAATPVVAIKIPEKRVSRDLAKIGQVGDSELREAWARVADNKSVHVETIGKIMDSAMPQKDGVIVMMDSDLTAKVLTKCLDSNPIVSDAILVFCERFALDQAWTVQSRRTG